MLYHGTKHREESWNTTSSRIFWRNFQVFGNAIKHCILLIKTKPKKIKENENRANLW